MVPGVEHLGTELQEPLFGPEGKSLAHGNIPVVHARAAQDAHSGIAEITFGG